MLGPDGDKNQSKEKEKSAVYRPGVCVQGWCCWPCWVAYVKNAAGKGMTERLMGMEMALLQAERR